MASTVNRGNTPGSIAPEEERNAPTTTTDKPPRPVSASIRLFWKVASAKNGRRNWICRRVRSSNCSPRCRSCWNDTISPTPWTEVHREGRQLALRLARPAAQPLDRVAGQHRAGGDENDERRKGQRGAPDPRPQASGRRRAGRGPRQPPAPWCARRNTRSVPRPVWPTPSGRPSAAGRDRREPTGLDA